MAQTTEGNSDLGEVVAQLVDDMTTIKQELLGSRWQQVADNFRQIGENFESLNRRLTEVEVRLDERDRGNESG